LNVFALKPDTIYVVRPENYDLIYKELNICSPDGYKIKTWFFPAQKLIHKNKRKRGTPYFSWDNKHPTRAYKTLDSKPKPTIIISDGDAGNMSGWIILAPWFLSHGYNIVTFDWRGFGESSPFVTDSTLMCYPEYLIDYNAVVDSIYKLSEVDSRKIGLYGASTGAYLSFAVAYTNINVNCFVGRALMTSFDDVFPFLFETIPSKRGITRKPENYPENLLPISIAKDFGKPIFLIVGENDTRTPVSMSKQIFDLAKSSEKELWVVRSAAHGGINGPEFKNFKKWRKKVLKFYDKYLKNNNMGY
jgi:alpha-beta hydrolase superfamily lysophospholipase